MEENNEKKTCNGRCEMCSVNQRTYCAAQMAYYNQQEIAEIKAMLASDRKKADETVILMGKAGCALQPDETVETEELDDFDDDEDLFSNVKAKESIKA